jgi:hypothetical protein
VTPQYASATLGCWLADELTSAHGVALVQIDMSSKTVRAQTIDNKINVSPEVQELQINQARNLYATCLISLSHIRDGQEIKRTVLSNR